VSEDEGMRKLSEFERERDAQRLIDVLLVAEIEGEVRGSEPWEVWVFDDRDLDRARSELAGFDPEAATASSRTAEKIRRRRERERERGSGRIDASARWRSDERPGLGPVTVFLIVGSVLVAFTGFDAPAQNGTIQNLSIEPWASGEFLGAVRRGEVWRLLTPMLIHFSLLHLVFNMLWLFRLGSAIEQRHGSLAMIGLVLLAQVPSGLGQYLASGPSFGGMSGVVYGLFGFVWMQARYNPARGYRLETESVVLMMIWFVLCLTGLVGPIANVGHAGGLIAGLAAGTPAYLAHRRERAASPAMAEGGWVEVNSRGLEGALRRYFVAYMPLWFLVVAAVALVVEFWP
jgi:GlpG protein